MKKISLLSRMMSLFKFLISVILFFFCFSLLSKNEQSEAEIVHSIEWIYISIRSIGRSVPVNSQVFKWNDKKSR